MEVSDLTLSAQAGPNLCLSSGNNQHDPFAAQRSRVHGDPCVTSPSGRPASTCARPSCGLI